MPIQDWNIFIDQYSTDYSYWYLPKGLVVKTDNFELIQKRLKVLNKYRGQDWSKVQRKFVRDLSKKGLFDKRAEGQEKKDKAAIGRMFKVVASTLGLAWINEKEKVFITEAGRDLIRANKRKLVQIITNQILRYQFYNPSFHKKEFNDIRVTPIQFICELLIALDTDYLTKDEYILFVAKKKTLDELSLAMDEIRKYRRLDDSQKRRLISNLKGIRIKTGNRRRSSIYNTILLESPYALSFFASSGIFSFRRGQLSLACDKKRLMSIIHEYRKNNVWIDFRYHKDWFYYYGQLSKETPIEFALRYYQDISDIDNAIKVYEEAKRRKLKISELQIASDRFKTIIVDEKIIEDFLEKHINELERDLKLVPNGRQYPTVSGPIDLLAKDSEGNYVIIELKKGRPSDKVIGQVSRYAAFLLDNITTIKKLRAIIVGKKIDRNLCLSIKVLSIPCKLYEFDYKIKFVEKKA